MYVQPAKQLQETLFFNAVPFYTFEEPTEIRNFADKMNRRRKREYIRGKVTRFAQAVSKNGLQSSTCMIQ